MLFPKWTNYLAPFFLLKAGIGSIFAVFVFWYWFAPANLEVGYRPVQPINYSHKLHAGQLAIDCRYCHYTVEQAAHAAIPPTEVCMNCHTLVNTESAEVQKIWKSYENNEPIAWKKVHMLPEYSYFNHARHVGAGVSCVSCHGRVDQMDVVFQAESLSMGWCLECHRNPEASIRPVELVTDLAWQAANPEEIGAKLIEIQGISPREDCSTCHR